MRETLQNTSHPPAEGPGLLGQWGSHGLADRLPWEGKKWGHTLMNLIPAKDHLVADAILLPPCSHRLQIWGPRGKDGVPSL